MNDPKIITRAERTARKLVHQEKAAQISFPSNWQMLKNVVQASGEVIIGGTESRNKEEIEAALKVCAACALLVNDSGKFRCGSCGCYLGGRKGQGLIGTSLGKVSLKSWSCPLGKW